MAKAVAHYSEETGEVKIVVPRGTKPTDLGAIIERCNAIVFAPPRICNTCLSGRQWQIVEEAPEVVQVDLDQ